MIMNYSTEPSQLVKVLVGVAAIMTILLSGVILGVLSSTDSITPIHRSVASIRPLDSQPDEDGLIHPVLPMDTRASKREALSTISPCQTRGAADSAPKACRQNPINPDINKLLVLLALWRKTS